jgi:hypothetical protein
MSVLTPDTIADVARLADEFIRAARLQAGMAWMIRPGMRCRILRKDDVKGVPPGAYTIDTIWRPADGPTWDGSVVSITAAALKVTAKTPRFGRVPVPKIDLEPDFARAFDAAGWRTADRFLHLSGIMARAVSSRSGVSWSIVADAVQDYWSELRESAAYEPGCRWAPLAALPDDAFDLVGRTFRNAEDFPMYSLPPGPSLAALYYNANPDDPRMPVG